MRLLLKFLLVPVLAAGAFCIGCAAPRPADVGDQVRKTLRENPQIVMDILKEHQDQVLKIVESAARARHEKARRARIEREINHPLSPSLDPGRMYLGNKDAPITIVGYSDFTCHFCAEGYKTVRELLARHPKELRFLLKHSPNSEFSNKLSLAFLAIGRQDPAKAWEYAGIVFKKQAELRKKRDAALNAILDGLHLDRKRLARDMKDPKLAAIVGGDAAEHHRFGFSGTPTYLIDGVSIRGAMPLAYFEEILSMINKKHGK